MRPSISRQLVLWLAVPLTLLALCGALVHYFNSIAPVVMSSDRRLKDAAGAVMAHRLPSPDAVLYAVRDAQGRLIEGDARLSPVPMSGDSATLITMMQLEHRVPDLGKHVPVSLQEQQFRPFYIAL